MHLDEATKLIRDDGTDNVDCFCCRGETRDERPFLCLFEHTFDKLPPAGDIPWSELEIDDDQGHDLVITLGPGGTVTGVRPRSTRDSKRGGTRSGIGSGAGKPAI